MTDATVTDQDTPSTSKGGRRGRRAHRPHHLPLKAWKDIFLRVKDELATDHVGLVAAGVAFYGLLAIFPAITAIMSVTGLIYSPTELVDALDKIASIVPQDVSEILLNQARDVAGGGDAGLTFSLLLSLGLAIWSASKGMGSLIEGMNVAYDEDETRGFLRLKGVTLGLTLLMIVGVVVAGGMVIVLPAMLSIFALSPLLETLIQWLSFLPLGLMMFAGILFLYRWGPDRNPARFSWLYPGAIAATLLWLAASVGFSLYVQNFGSYNETFGSIAGVVVLLMWLWISAYVVILGAELNAEMEAQTARDSTVGEPRPMGERDAVKADRLGEAQ